MTATPPTTPSERLLAKIHEDTAAIRWHAYLIAIVVVLWAIISIVNAVSAAR